MIIHMIPDDGCVDCNTHTAETILSADGQTYIAPCPLSRATLQQNLKELYSDTKVPDVFVHGSSEHVGLILPDTEFLLMLCARSSY